MTKKKYPSRLENREPLTRNDLKLINGIGPTVEKRLNGIGIYTFAQLATFSPADVAAVVADLSGLSAERIIKQDWIGQARKLASGEVELHGEASTSDAAHEDVGVSAEPEQDAEDAISLEPPGSTEPALSHSLFPEPESEMDIVPPVAGHHPVAFTVEFLLDENNHVESTHVLHMQSGRKHAWMGWQKTQLIDFMCESAGLNVRLDEPAIPVAGEGGTESIEKPGPAPGERTGGDASVPPVTLSRSSSVLHLRELEVIGVNSGSFRRTLVQNEPFDVQLTLDMTELKMPGNSQLNYNTTIYGRGQGKPGLVLGKAEGSIIPSGRTTITVKGNALPEGIYRLAAKVTVRQMDSELTTKSSTSGVIDGGVVQVY